jgi:hypothetical protein
MMWAYVRIIRTDPVFLRAAAAEEIGAGGGKSGWSEWFSGWGDFDGFLVLLAILALVVLVGVWIGAEGPALLLDEASAAAIAAGLAGRTAFLPDESWLPRVVRRTLWTVLIYLILSSIVMGYADVHCPGQPSFSGVIRACVIPQRGV